MATTTASVSYLPAAIRIAAAVFGGYAFCWGFIAMTTAGLYGAGLKFHDAEHLGNILAFLLYPATFCWVFCTRRLARAWGVLAGGGLAMAVAASLLQHLLTT